MQICATILRLGKKLWLKSVLFNFIIIVSWSLDPRHWRPWDCFGHPRLPSYLQRMSILKLSIDKHRRKYSIGKSYRGNPCRRLVRRTRRRAPYGKASARQRSLVALGNRKSRGHCIYGKIANTAKFYKDINYNNNPIRHIEVLTYIYTNWFCIWVWAGSAFWDRHLTRHLLVVLPGSLMIFSSSPPSKIIVTISL